LTQQKVIDIFRVTSSKNEAHMQIDYQVKLGFDDVLIRPKRSNLASRQNVELSRSFTTLNSKQKLDGIPIIAANMDVVGTFGMAEELGKLGIYTSLHKFYSEDKIIKFFNTSKYSEFAFYTTGITPEDIGKLRRVLLSTDKIKCISIDVANGYSEFFQDMVGRIRDLNTSMVIMAGNVATPEMVQELLISGLVDIVKVGIGPGSRCQTRMVTGVGYPQLSAIIECADAAHGLGGLICADGGCKNSGDVAKAFGAGADFVMLGGMFAGCIECEGEWVEDADSPYGCNRKIKFYGMSSKQAMEKYYGGMADYKASEGDCTLIDYKGPAALVAKEICGGLRSACSYVGAASLKDLSKCTTFVRCTSIK
jgi:GMP reductase